MIMRSHAFCRLNKGNCDSHTLHYTVAANDTYDGKIGQVGTLTGVPP